MLSLLHPRRRLSALRDPLCRLRFFVCHHVLTNLSLSVALRAGPPQSLKVALPSVHVMGIPSVSRAVINEEASGGGSGGVDQKGGKIYYLLVEGYGLQDVMGR